MLKQPVVKLLMTRWYYHIYVNCRVFHMIIIVSGTSLNQDLGIIVTIPYNLFHKRRNSFHASKIDVNFLMQKLNVPEFVPSGNEPHRLYIL